MMMMMIVMNVIVMMEMVMWVMISTKIGHQLTVVMTAASDVMHFINNKSINKMQNKKTFQMTQSFYHKTKR